MTISKSFQITLRWVFVLFSLQFLRDAFFRWDGYSFYMTFLEFLPDLSFVFVLWTLLGVLCAIVVWVLIFIASKNQALLTQNKMGEMISTSADFIRERMIANKDTIQKVSEETTRQYNKSAEETRKIYLSRNASSLESARYVIVS